MKYLWTLISFIFSVSNAYAANTLIPDGSDETGLGEKFQQGTLQLYDIPVYVKYLTEKLVWVAAVLALIMVMIGGYKYITGSFNDSTDEAKNTILNVIYGLAFVVFAWMIIDLIIRVVTEG